MSAPCPVCGTPMTGVMFVDGYRNGRSFGELRAYCVPCEEAQYPHRDNPFARAFRAARVGGYRSLRDVADRLGLHPKDISAVEMGRVPPPVGDEARRWWVVLGGAPQEDGR